MALARAFRESRAFRERMRVTYACGRARAPGQSEAEPPKATIIKHPVQVAPPHSLTPPPDTGDSLSAAEVPEDDTKKTA